MAQLGDNGIERTELERVNDEVGTEVDEAEAKASSNRRITAALNLYLAGASYLDIANALDYSSPQAARMAVERAFASIENDEADKTAARRKMGAQFDMLLKAVAPKAIDKGREDQLGYVNAATNILRHKAALFGLNAPTHIRIDPTGDDLDRALEMVLVAADALPSPEGDPWQEDAVDAEVIEDEPA